MPRRRLGVVLLLPQPVASEVDGLRRACGDTQKPFVPPHITLVPPINVREDAVADALALVRAAAAALHGPIQLTIGPAATFHPLNPVLYLEVGGPDVERVRILREGVLRGPLERVTDYDFVPHVTIGYEMSHERLAAGTLALGDYRAEVVLDRIHVMEEGDDRVWRPLADAPLGPTTVVGRGGLELELGRSLRPDPEATAFAAREWERHARDTYGEDVPPDEPFAVVARRADVSTGFPRVVGVATGEIRGSECYLARLIVDASERGLGVGSALLADVESFAAESGCTAVTLRCIVGGPAEALYRARGFEPLYKLPQWRHGRDFVQMTRRLAPS